MRPVSITAEGFTAFRDAATVDFTGAEFFALVGPTGSGKSSVLDAICFALYGIVPRYDDDRLVAPSITQGAHEARVSLTFELGGSQYVATRIVRRTKSGGATTKEARLERDGEVLAGDAKGMNEAVAELIGLPFRHFTRCVILPQGEFAQFLHDKPSDRQDLLVKLLDLTIYERMRKRAAQLADEKENEVALDEKMIERFADCTSEALVAATADLEAVGELRKQLDDAEPRAAELQAAVQGALAAGQRAGRIVSLLREVRVPQPVRSLQAERDHGVAAQRSAAEAEEAAGDALAQAEASASAQPDPAEIKAALDARGDLSDVLRKLDQNESKVAALGPELSDAATSLAEAERTREEHEAALHDHVPTELIAALVVGEPCPVCAQVVTKKPKARLGDADRARKALDAARKAEARARDRLAKAQTAIAAASGEHEALVGQRAALDKRVKGLPDSEALSSELAEARAARAAVDAARQAHAGAVKAERTAGEVVTKLDRELERGRRQCTAQRDPLVSEGLEPPHVEGELVAAWDGLVAWAADASPTHEAARDAETERANVIGIELVSMLVDLRDAAAEVGVEADDDPGLSVLGQRAAVAERDANAEQARIKNGIKESSRLTKRLEKVRDEIEVARALANLLKSTGFEKWLVNEALERLVLGASETLELLSGNQYALAVNEGNEFEVIDHRNADDRRAAKTLSGGETFQASLALALALADQVGAMAAGGAAKLDSIFLDEGFGTLDADSLDAVASALETLGSDDRMVGIVTHVRELAERVPVRYEVVKGPRTSTITRVDT
jgi:DNA repair protein SbcC/Rad50